MEWFYRRLFVVVALLLPSLEDRTYAKPHAVTSKERRPTSQEKYSSSSGRQNHSKHKNATSRPVVLEHLTTHARYALRPNANTGFFSKRQLQAIQHVLKCHHTGKEKAIHPDLVSLLYEIGAHYRFAKIYIIAGYRDPKIARKKGNPKSPHQQGVASDIRVDGIPPEQLRDYLLLNHHGIGVGYYPHSGFVHVDVARKHNAYWIDASLPGQQAFYIDSTLRGKQLKNRLVAAKRLLVKRHLKRHHVALHPRRTRSKCRQNHCGTGSRFTHST